MRSIGLFSRDPIGFVDGVNLYNANWGVGGVDPLGNLAYFPGDFDGEQDGTSDDDGRPVF